MFSLASFVLFSLFLAAGVHVVHFKFTVLVRSSGTTRITGENASVDFYKTLDLECEKMPNEELKKVRCCGVAV